MGNVVVLDVHDYLNDMRNVMDSYLEFGKIMACSEIKREMRLALCNLDEPELDYKKMSEIVNKVCDEAERNYRDLKHRGEQ